MTQPKIKTTALDIGPGANKVLTTDSAGDVSITGKLDATKGVLTKAVGGGANVTLTATEARNDIITFTGVLTANIDVIVPARARSFQMYNNTSGAFTLRVKTAAGAGYYLQQGMNTDLICNGTSVTLADNTSNSFGGQYGWQDLRGNFIGARLGTSSNAPAWTVVTGGIYGYTFAHTASEDEAWVTFHLPHDYVTGTPVYVHVHWAPTNTSVGTVRWAVEYTVAKGYNQGAFGPSTTIFLEQAASGVALTHQIVETPVGDAIPATNLEPDSLVLVRFYRNSTHVNDTYEQPAFAFEVDLHYQSTMHQTTKNKNYPFS